jgi:phosphatidylglycerophosphate synthase
VRILGTSARRPFSQDNRERLRRSFARIGISDVDTADVMPRTGRVVLLRGDWLFDDALARVLAEARDGVLVVGEGGDRRAVAAMLEAGRAQRALALLAADQGFDAAAWQALGLGVRTLAEAASVAYRGNLRNRVPPYVLPLERMSVAEIERHMFMASYKGVTDVVTKHLFPAPALVVTRWCAARGISPNAVTLVSFLCVVAATVLFAIGWYGTGLACAWSMCFLDTVDGKLARVTLTSSKWGNVFDHGTDLVHPPFWWFAWYWGLHTLPFPPVAGVEIATGIVLAGYVLGRAQEGIFLWAFGIEMHVWQRLDSFFRGITARRNPNLVLFMLATIAGRPDWGLLLVAAWTVISFVFHCVRIAQAFQHRAREGRVVSWLAAPA